MHYINRANARDYLYPGVFGLLLGCTSIVIGLKYSILENGKISELDLSMIMAGYYLVGVGLLKCSNGDFCMDSSMFSVGFIVGAAPELLTQALKKSTHFEEIQDEQIATYDYPFQI